MKSQHDTHVIGAVALRVLSGAQTFKHGRQPGPGGTLNKKGLKQRPKKGKR